MAIQTIRQYGRRGAGTPHLVTPLGKPLCHQTGKRNATGQGVSGGWGHDVVEYGWICAKCRAISEQNQALMNEFMVMG